MSGFIEGENRYQSTLFPERIDDYVEEDSVVRVIDDFIDRLYISGLGFKAEAAETGIQFKSVDLDPVAYQKDNLGGEHIGGCTETFDAFNDGSLQKLMTENALQFDASKNVDAYTFLPKWLVAR